VTGYLRRNAVLIAGFGVLLYMFLPIFVVVLMSFNDPASRIELYLKPSGDELDRAEAYENLTLREQNRETKGSKMIYTTANETYVITGTPVKIVDQCRRETIGRTLTFNKGTDSVIVDGNSQIRTQTKGGNGNCS